MTIHPAALPNYLASRKDAPLMRVCEEDGTLWRILPQNRILALARAESIYGKGSPTRLKYCVLQVPQQRAEEVIGEAVDRLHSSPSKTTTVERKSTVRDGRTFRYTLHQHDKARCFAWKHA